MWTCCSTKARKTRWAGAANPGHPQEKGNGHGLEEMLAAESITINIQHVERLEVRHYHLGRDADGNVVLPQA